MTYKPFKLYNLFILLISITIKVTPLVDVNGTPMLDIATGQPLLAAPLLASPVQIQVAVRQLFDTAAGAGCSKYKIVTSPHY